MKVYQLRYNKETQDVFFVEGLDFYRRRTSLGFYKTDSVESVAEKARKMITPKRRGVLIIGSEVPREFISGLERKLSRKEYSRVKLKTNGSNH